MQTHGSSSSYSQPQTFAYLGVTLPTSVNLANQLTKNVPQQGNSTFCSVFSTVSLLEAACKSVSKKEVDLSEAYIAYLLLQYRLDERRGTENGLLATPHQILGLYREHSGGYDPVKILELMQRGNVGESKRLNSDLEFASAVREIENRLFKENYVIPLREKIGKWKSMAKENVEKVTQIVFGHPKNKLEYQLRQPHPAVTTATYSPIQIPIGTVRPPVPGEYPIYYPNLMETPLRKEITESEVSPVYRSLSSEEKREFQSPELRECLEQLDPPTVIERGSRLEAMTLLDQGSPFVCTRNNHATIIAGYRTTAESDHDIEWLVRDSANRSAPMTWKKGGGEGAPCNVMMAVFPKVKTNKVQIALAIGKEIRESSEAKWARQRKAKLKSEIVSVDQGPYVPKPENSVSTERSLFSPGAGTK